MHQWRLDPRLHDGARGQRRRRRDAPGRLPRTTRLLALASMTTSLRSLPWRLRRHRHSHHSRRRRRRCCRPQLVPRQVGGGSHHCSLGVASAAHRPWAPQEVPRACRRQQHHQLRRHCCLRRRRLHSQAQTWQRAMRRAWSDGLRQVPSLGHHRACQWAHSQSERWMAPWRASSSPQKLLLWVRQARSQGQRHQSHRQHRRRHQARCCCGWGRQQRPHPTLAEGLLAVAQTLWW